MIAPAAFVHELRLADLPPQALAAARRLLLDLAGVAAAGTAMRMSRIARGFAASAFPAGEAGAPILFDGRRVAPPAAAMAGAFTLDSLDAHDGWRECKGHAGCASLPAALAFPVETGAELLTRLVLGYELGCRAGAALHATAADYHSSGAWVALACAGIGARALGLSREATRHALGIAEYHGPRGPMMRCIDHPSMVKDGSGWGAMAGVSAALLAARGFTGAPAALTEGAEAAPFWRDLGARWLVCEQYLKPEPVCRWAQPAIHAALRLRAAHGFGPEEIEAVAVETFAEAARLAVRRPRSTEEAQYSLPFPLGAALARGRVGPEAVSQAGLEDPETLRLAALVELRVSPEFSALFPGRRLSAVTVTLADGRRLQSGPVEAEGDPERPLSDAQVAAKFHAYADPALGPERAARLRAAVEALPDGEAAPLLALLTAPAATG
jgi:2-methylcitrate dehydratase PrpD